MPGKDPCLDVARLPLLQALELGHHPHQQAHSPHREDLPRHHPPLKQSHSNIIVKKNLKHMF